VSYSNITNPANYQLQAFGQKGFRVLTSSSTPVSGEFYRAITVTSDAVVTATSAAEDNLTAVPVFAGTTIYGLFSAVGVSSGVAIAYIA
jgi:hypothetical protein